MIIAGFTQKDKLTISAWIEPTAVGKVCIDSNQRDG